jgi:hypothetical protein
MQGMPVMEATAGLHAFRFLVTKGHAQSTERPSTLLVHVLSPIPDQGPAVSPPTTAKMTQMERIDRTTASAGGPYDTQRYSQYDQVLRDDVDADV